MSNTIQQQIDCVQREIRMRERVYPRLIDQQKITPEGATHELDCMKSVLETLRAASVRAGESLI